MLKIIQIIPNLRKGGAERLVLNICNELQKRKDVEILLITFSKENDYKFLTKNINWEVIPAQFIPSISGKSIRNISNLQARINSFEPDVIHSHLFESEMALTQVNYPQAKFFSHCHDNMKQFENLSLFKLPSKIKVTNWFERRIVLKSYRDRKTQLICISKNTFNYFQSNVPNRIAKKTLLLNAIDTSVFNNNTPLKEKHESNEITIIGSLVKKKAHELAISIIAELNKRGFKYNLNILGDGERMSELKTLARELQVSHLCKFHGSVDNPEEYLKNSFIYLHTAKYEPFGLVLLEAMASGTPVICSDGVGNTDLINHRVNGYIFSTRNVDEYADTIIELQNSKSKWEGISRNGLLISSKFDIKNYCENLLKKYQLSF